MDRRDSLQVDGADTDTGSARECSDFRFPRTWRNIRVRSKYARMGSATLSNIRRKAPTVLFRAATLFVIFLSSYAATLAQTVPPGVVKDEPPFRKRTFAEKAERKCPTGLFVPPGYTSDKKYPLIVWFHGGAGRGSDNEAQISNGNEKGSHLWTTAGNQEKFPAFVLAPQCAQRENWSDPELNEIGRSLTVGFGHPGARRKGLFHRSRSRVSRGAVHGRPGCVGATAKISGAMGGSGGRGFLR